MIAAKIRICHFEFEKKNFIFYTYIVKIETSHQQLQFNMKVYLTYLRINNEYFEKQFQFFWFEIKFSFDLFWTLNHKLCLLLFLLFSVPFNTFHLFFSSPSYQLVKKKLDDSKEAPLADPEPTSDISNQNIPSTYNGNINRPEAIIEHSRLPSHKVLQSVQSGSILL